MFKFIRKLFTPKPTPAQIAGREFYNDLAAITLIEIALMANKKK